MTDELKPLMGRRPSLLTICRSQEPVQRVVCLSLFFLNLFFLVQGFGLFCSLQGLRFSVPAASTSKPRSRSVESLGPSSGGGLPGQHCE